MINERLFTLSVCLLCMATSIVAQNTQDTLNSQNTQKIYNNEWIDFQQTYYKIKIHEEGVYRIPSSVLESHQIVANGSAYKMMFAGEEIPIYVSNKNKFTEDDFIEFYGNKLNGDLDTHLFENQMEQLHTFESLFTDTATYFLLVDSLEEHLRYEDTPNNLENAPDARPYFIHQSVHYEKDNYFNGVGVRFSGVNVYLSDYDEGEGFLGNVFGVHDSTINNSMAIQLPTKYIYRDGPAADIELKVAGLSDDFFTNNDHTIQVKLNDKEIVNERYEGYNVRAYSIDNYPLEELIDSTYNVVEFSALGFTSSVDRSAVSFITLDYPRTFDFEDLTQFAFNLSSNSVTTDFIEIKNFNDENSIPILLDKSNGFRMEGLVENNTVRFHLPKTAHSKRCLFLYQNNENTVNEIKHLTKRNFTNYAELAQHGNYILISHSNLMQSGYVNDYANYRSSEVGGNYKPIIVDVEQLYDQFAWGIQKHPLAIKNFMDYAFDEWNEQPEYLLLVGKSIKNSLCRYDTTNWKNNLVPSYGESPSDWQFARYGKTEIRKIAVSRISAAQPEDVLNYLNKVKQYEQTDINYCDAEQLSWRKEVLHMQRLIALWEPKPARVYRRIMEDTLYGANFKCLNHLDTLQQDSLQYLLNRKGIGIITYFGQSTSTKNWDYNAGEAKEYKDNARYPFIFSFSQFTGDIHQPHSTPSYKPSMSEEWVLEKNAGAIAYLGATDYGFPPSFNDYGEELYRQLAYKNYNQPIGKSMLNTIQTIYRDNEGILITSEEMNLQGDPAIIINYMPKPEFEINANHLIFKPDTITNPLDSIEISLQLINAGTYNLSDTIQLCIERKDAADMVLNTHKEALLVANKKTFTTTLFAEGQPILESDSYTFYLDCDNKVEENCEENNYFETSLFMVGIEENMDNPADFDLVDFPKIYPIPARNQFNLSVQSKLPQLLQLTCYHISGALMMQQNLNIQKGANQFTLDVQNWQRGTYIIKMGSDNQYLFSKMLKQ